MRDLASFVLAGLALTGSPGPATLGIAASGAAFGPRRSLALIVGSIVGVVLVMMMTATGVGGLLMAQPGLAPAMGLLAAGYMVYLAYRIGTAPPLTDNAAGEQAPGFGLGLFLGLGNPKAYVAMAALFSGFVLVEANALADAAAKIGVLVVIIVAVDLAWVLLGSALTARMRDPTMSRIINVAFAVLLVASLALTFKF